MFALLQASPEPWWKHAFETFIGAGVPVILWMLENRRRAKNEAKKNQQAIREELEKKHKENTDRMDSQDGKLDEILNERKYVPAHMHREMSGPLMAEGVHYPQKG